jgi:nucleotide-binding universal stress UspA family protein
MSGYQEILVGYDASPDAAVALDWALDEAAHGGQPVRLAYAFEWVTVVGWVGPGIVPGMVPGIWPDENARRQVEQLVQRAATEAAARRPGVTVRGEVFDGPPALVLQEHSASAGLLVLGSRGHGGFVGLLVGSTATAVAAHAHCPVVVVRADSGPAGRTGPIVVGVDGSDTSLLALGFAVERAAQRDVPLRVLRVWEPTGGDDADPDAATTAELAALRAPLARWREAFPNVEIAAEVVPGRPAAVLVAASQDAQLVVVGSRGRGGLRGMLLGSVGQQLIQHARCPVAILRERR